MTCLGNIDQDVAATYMVWLRHELFAAPDATEAFAASEEAFAGYILNIGKFHLKEFLATRPVPRTAS